MVAEVRGQNHCILRAEECEYGISEPAALLSGQRDLRSVYDVLQGFSPIVVLIADRVFGNRIPHLYQGILMLLQRKRPALAVWTSV